MKFVEESAIKKGRRRGSVYFDMFEELIKLDGKAIELNLEEHNQVSVKAMAYRFNRKSNKKLSTGINRAENKMWIWVRNEKVD